jgi:multiple sugar transport system permease protein
MEQTVSRQRVSVQVRVKQRKQSPSSMILIYLFLLLGAVLTIMPFTFTLLSSFKSPVEIRQVPPTFFPQTFTLDNYRTVLSDPDLPLARFYINSAYVAILNVGIVLMTSSLFGYIFAKFEFRGKNVLFGFILFQLMIPFQVTMIPNYLILVQMGLINNLHGLIVPSAINAFGIFLVRQFIRQVPNEVLDAARVDGASEWGIYLRVVLPQIGSALAALGILTFMFNWNSYLWPLIVLTSPENRTLPIILSWYTTQQNNQLNLSMAASVLVMTPVLLVFILLQKWIVQGFALSGLKG